MHAWLHEVRVWLWRRQVWALQRSCRPTGTTEGDWIAANVAASASSAGTGG